MRELHSLSLQNLYRLFSAQDYEAYARHACRLIRVQNADIAGPIRAHVLADDWMDFTHEALSRHVSRAQGLLYVVASEANPELVKVGKTRGNVNRRLAQLNNEAVVQPFVLLAEHAVHDRHWLELEVHRFLTAHGVHRTKEFFNTTPEGVALAVTTVVAQDAARFAAQGLYLPSASSPAYP